MLIDGLKTVAAEMEAHDQLQRYKEMMLKVLEATEAQNLDPEAMKAFYKPSVLRTFDIVADEIRKMGVFDEEFITEARKQVTNPFDSDFQSWVFPTHFTWELPNTNAHSILGYAIARGINKAIESAYDDSQFSHKRLNIAFDIPSDKDNFLDTTDYRMPDGAWFRIGVGFIDGKPAIAIYKNTKRDNNNSEYSLIRPEITL